MLTTATLHTLTSVWLVQPSNEAIKKTTKTFFFILYNLLYGREKSINQGQKDQKQFRWIIGLDMCVYALLWSSPRHRQYLKGTSPLPISCSGILETLIKTKARNLCFLLRNSVSQSAWDSKPTSCSVLRSAAEHYCWAAPQPGNEPRPSPFSQCRALALCPFFSKTFVFKGHMFSLHIGYDRFYCNPLNCV